MLGTDLEYHGEWLLVPLWLVGEPRAVWPHPSHSPQAGAFLYRIQVRSGELGRSPGERRPQGSGVHSVLPCGGESSLEEMLAVPKWQEIHMDGSFQQKDA